MPTYDYECSKCGHRVEIVCRIADRPSHLVCEQQGDPREYGGGFPCSGVMRQIIVAPAIQVDTAQDVPWLADFARKRKEARFGGKPIETRTEYRQYLKDHNLRDPHKGENLTEI
ncbi:MAG: FmdB family zinc ribbon protein [Dehalococcoidia bacterium]